MSRLVGRMIALRCEAGATPSYRWRPDRLDQAVADRATGECVGEVVFNEWNPAAGSCNFRVLLGPAGRDRGAGHGGGPAVRRVRVRAAGPALGGAGGVRVQSA